MWRVHIGVKWTLFVPKTDDTVLHSYALMHCITVLSFVIIILLMCIAIC